LLAIAHFASGQEPQRLEPSNPIEREIAGGESHNYQITLAAGQFVRIEVEQKSVDVKLALSGPDGKRLVESDLIRLVGFTEPLSYEAAAPGTFQLTVTANTPSQHTGAYLITADVKGSAVPQDRKRIAAESLLSEARQLYIAERYDDPMLTEKLGQALALFRELEDGYLQGLALNLTGLTHAMNRRFDKAAETYEQVLPLWQGEKLRAGKANLLRRIGYAYDELEQYEKAVGYFDQALVGFRELKDRPAEAATLKALGYANMWLGKDEDVIAVREQALAIYRELKDRESEADAIIDLALIYSMLQRYDRTIEYNQQAIDLARAEKNRKGEMMALTNIGIAYGEWGNPEKAIEYGEQALSIVRELKDFSGEVGALLNLGAAYSKSGRTEKAIEYFQQALSLAREKQLRVSEVRPLVNLAVSEMKRLNWEKAIEYLEQSLAIARETNNRHREADSFLNLAGAYAGMGRTDKAVEYYKMYVTNRRELGEPRGTGLGLHLLGLTERKRNPAAARAYIEESQKIMEGVRRGLMTPQSRLQHAATIHNSFKVYTEVVMRQHQAEPAKGFDVAAFESSEFARARGLLDQLAEAGMDIREGIDADLLERERTIGEQLSKKAGMLMGTKPEQAEALKREIDQLETEYERVQAAIRKASPNYAALAQPQPVKLSQIQGELDADTLLLEYSLGAEGQEQSYLWAITRDSLTTYELPKGEDIEKSAREVYELLTARSTNKPGETPAQKQIRITDAEAKLPNAAKELSQIILAPVAAQLGGKRLIIVADGALQYIPFAMLPDPATGGTQPLVVGHEVVSLPSASTLVIQRKELAGRQPAPKTLAVIADPVFDRTDPRFKTAVPLDDKAPASSVKPADMRGLEHIVDGSSSSGRLVIRRLPFTRQEADALVALTPKNSTFKAIDFQANRTNVLSGDLSQYRYVHFATHGVMDAERPGLSSLVLSTVDAAGKPQNGFLRANDIYNMKLPAELVVLSACQTGLGKEVKGEGLIGLTRGFMYAGARRVVVSLWSVSDKATSDLMTKFYRGILKNNERPAAALRAAQIEMWKQKKWQSPYYWAGFTMQGEWR
jgi:CHAT domain-containing protein/tetratricopeptide (TPR) repeat protein